MATKNFFTLVSGKAKAAQRPGAARHVAEVNSKEKCKTPSTRMPLPEGKLNTASGSSTDQSKSKDNNRTKDEEQLERLAMEELLLEAKRGAERAREIGIAGWIKPVVPPTNKRFLASTLRSTFPSRRYRRSRSRSKSREKSSKRNFYQRRRSYSRSRSGSRERDSRLKRHNFSPVRGANKDSAHRISDSRSQRSRKFQESFDSQAHSNCQKMNRNSRRNDRSPPKQFSQSNEKDSSYKETVMKSTESSKREVKDKETVKNFTKSSEEDHSDEDTVKNSTKASEKKRRDKDTAKKSPKSGKRECSDQDTVKNATRSSEKDHSNQDSAKNGTKSREKERSNQDSVKKSKKSVRQETSHKDYVKKLHKSEEKECRSSKSGDMGHCIKSEQDSPKEENSFNHGQQERAAGQSAKAAVEQQISHVNGSGKAQPVADTKLSGQLSWDSQAAESFNAADLGNKAPAKQETHHLHTVEKHKNNSVRNLVTDGGGSPSRKRAVESSEAESRQFMETESLHPEIKRVKKDTQLPGSRHHEHRSHKKKKEKKKKKKKHKHKKHKARE